MCAFSKCMLYHCSRQLEVLQIVSMLASLHSFLSLKLCRALPISHRATSMKKLSFKNLVEALQKERSPGGSSQNSSQCNSPHHRGPSASGSPGGAFTLSGAACLTITQTKQTNNNNKSTSHLLRDMPIPGWGPSPEKGEVQSGQSRFRKLSLDSKPEHRRSKPELKGRRSWNQKSSLDRVEEPGSDRSSTLAVWGPEQQQVCVCVLC